MSTMEFQGFLLRHGPLEVEWTDGLLRVTSSCTFLCPEPFQVPGLIEALAQNDLIHCTFTVNEPTP